MAETIKIRVVVEEVVVDFEGSLDNLHYSNSSIEGFITKTVKSAIELHNLRKAPPVHFIKDMNTAIACGGAGSATNIKERVSCKACLEKLT